MNTQSRGGAERGRTTRVLGTKEWQELKVWGRRGRRGRKEKKPWRRGAGSEQEAGGRAQDRNKSWRDQV